MCTPGRAGWGTTYVLASTQFYLCGVRGLYPVSLARQSSASNAALCARPSRRASNVLHARVDLPAVDVRLVAGGAEAALLPQEADVVREARPLVAHEALRLAAHELLHVARRGVQDADLAGGPMRKLSHLRVLKLTKINSNE